MKKEKAKAKSKKRYYIGGIAVISVLVLIYLAVSLFFMNRYYPGTMIGDFSCGGMTQAEVEGMIRDRARGYTLTIEGREETEAALAASEIQLQFVLDNTLQEIIDRQNGFAWLPSLWRTIQYELPVTVSYDEALLQEKMSGMLLFQKENMRSPSNAYIGEYDQEIGMYPIIEEDKGTVISRQKAESAIVDAIKQMDEVLVLDEAGCYMDPEIGKDNDALVRFCSRLNRFVSSRIVYDWHGMEEVVDGSLIHEWLDIDREQQTVAINATAVREYINSLSKKHDTFGKEREFRTSEGRKITLKPGSYGWRVDRAKETEKLIKLIRAGSHVSREPEYLYTAAAKGENDIGDSYVEINLSAQHLYLYVEGKLITESDFVSGNVARGFSTPDGVYGLTYKTLNATLKGQGYASPVDFWMPFNGNIGMHDASWRKQFGGSIYLRNGSHGCINLPREAAETIYEQVYKGFPVVCYKDEASVKPSQKGTGEKGSGQTDQNQVPGTGDGTDIQPGVNGLPTDPNTGLPGVIDPGTGLPGTVIDPNTGQPGAVTDPNTGQPGTVTDPNAGQPGAVTDPNAGQPGAVTDPNAGQPGAVADPNAGQPAGSVAPPVENPSAAVPQVP